MLRVKGDLMGAIDTIRIAAFVGFFVCAIVCNITLLTLIGERRDRSVSGFRLLFFPFLLAPHVFTDRGRLLYSRFKRVFVWAFGCWLVFGLSMFA